MRFVREHLKLLVPLAVLGVAALVFVLVWFQPQKLVIEKRVSETAPPATSRPVVARELMGTFKPGEHPVKGTARVIGSGRDRVVRFENFETSNGPDVVVYLSTANANAPWGEFAKEFVDLGPLKGNIGNQNYAIPAGTDLKRYHTVVVWCRRFTVPFAAAQLS